MSSTYHNEIKVTFVYADATRKTYEIPDVDDADLDADTVREKVQQLNLVMGGGSSTDTAATEYGQHMPATFVSSSGASATKISAVNLVSTEEEVIYSG